MNSIRYCPFCGSLEVDIIEAGLNYVRCLNCEAEGPIKNTSQEAIKAWNNRKKN